MGRRGVPAASLLSKGASYQGKRPVGGRPDQRRSAIIAQSRATDTRPATPLYGCRGYAAPRYDSQTDAF